MPKIYPNHLLFQIVQQVDKVSLHCTVRCYKDLIFYNFETFCVTACLHYGCLITLNVELSTATKRKKRWKTTLENLLQGLVPTARTYKTPSVNNVYIKPGFENTAYGHLTLKVQCCLPLNLLASILLHFCWPMISFS